MARKDTAGDGDGVRYDPSLDADGVGNSRMAFTAPLLVGSLDQKGAETTTIATASPSTPAATTAAAATNAATTKRTTIVSLYRHDESIDGPNGTDGILGLATIDTTQTCTAGTVTDRITTTGKEATVPSPTRTNRYE